MTTRGLFLAAMLGLSGTVSAQTPTIVDTSASLHGFSASWTIPCPAGVKRQRSRIVIYGQYDSAAAPWKSKTATFGWVTCAVTPPPPPPAPALSSVVVNPATVAMLTGAQQQFTATGQYTDGSSKPLVAAWQASGGTINTGGLFTAGATAGAFTVVGADPSSGKADTSTVTLTAPQPPPVDTAPPPPPAPAGYDPARLGSALLAGSAHPAFGNLGVNADTVADPRGVFGRVLRIRNIARTGSTVQHQDRFAPQSHFWFRFTMLLDGNGNRNGWQPTSGGPYPFWHTPWGSLEPGGSTTYKLVFAHNTAFANRMEIVQMNGGHLVTGSSHSEPNKVEVPFALSGKGCAPNAAHRYIDFRTSAVPTTTTAPHDFQATRDWYEFTFRYEITRDTTVYVQQYFMRRLTVAGVWAPWPFPVWTGFTTTGRALLYNIVQLTGNKSQTNDGPNDMYVFLGPYEVTNHPDPYGWACYGK